MKKVTRWWNGLFRGCMAGVAALMLLAAAGCEDDDDYDDHNPPEGQGSLVVVNNTADDLEVFVDGSLLLSVRDGKTSIVDRDPGRVRVNLRDEDSSRGWRGNVDILEGRLTVLRVTYRLTGDDYDVNVDYER